MALLASWRLAYTLWLEKQFKGVSDEGLARYISWCGLVMALFGSLGVTFWSPTVAAERGLWVVGFIALWAILTILTGRQALRGQHRIAGLEALAETRIAEVKAAIERQAPAQAIPSLYATSHQVSMCGPHGCETTLVLLNRSATIPLSLKFRLREKDHEHPLYPVTDQWKDGTDDPMRWFFMTGVLPVLLKPAEQLTLRLRFRRWVLDEHLTTPKEPLVEIEDISSGLLWSFAWGQGTKPQA